MVVHLHNRTQENFEWDLKQWTMLDNLNMHIYEHMVVDSRHVLWQKTPSWKSTTYVNLCAYWTVSRCNLPFQLGIRDSRCNSRVRRDIWSWKCSSSTGQVINGVKFEISLIWGNDGWKARNTYWCRTYPRVIITNRPVNSRFRFSIKDISTGNVLLDQETFDGMTMHLTKSLLFNAEPSAPRIAERSGGVITNERPCNTNSGELTFRSVE